MNNQTSKAKVLALRPKAKVSVTQIQFQKMYNINNGVEFLGRGFTKESAWNDALKNMS